MKRRTRTQPTNPFYSNEPAVSISKIADKPPVLNASLGNKTPKMVDKHPGKMSGVADFASKSKPPKGNSHINLPTLGTKAKQPAQLRLSGHSGAHQIGVKKLKNV